jgi:RimJ/RimL family protein N-acetyltransferase
MSLFSLSVGAGPTPVIETGNLRLRVHRSTDYAESAAMWNDPLVYRYITGKPGTESELWARLLRYAGHWALMGYGFWLVEERARGRFVGEVGFADVKREIEPPLKGMPEIGWVLASSMHGKGYGTEAVRAALAWGDANFGSSRTTCIVSPGNSASLRLAAKFNYRERQRTAYGGDPTIVFIREPGGGVTPTQRPPFNDHRA